MLWIGVDCIEFLAWPSTPRLYRDCTITEKLDGTNACVAISEDGEVVAPSRKRIITPEDDNYGFAKWVYNNAIGLRETLGAGYHFGEWYGQGIQRNYGLAEKRFALFNVNRWGYLRAEGSPVDGLEVVPVLVTHTFSDDLIQNTMDNLRIVGSEAAPGFMKPEGIVIWHHAAQQKFKVLLEQDELPKSLAGAA